MIIVKTRIELIKLLRKQQDIIHNIGNDPKLLKKHLVFNAQGRWIDSFVKNEFKEFKRVDYRFSSFRQKPKIILLYLLIGLFLFNGMWSSYFYISIFDSNKESNSILELIHLVTNILTIIFFVGFICFYFLKYKRVGEGESQNNSIKLSPVSKYLDYLQVLEATVKSMQVKELNEKLRSNLC